MISSAPLDIEYAATPSRSVNRGGVTLYESTPGVLTQDYRVAGVTNMALYTSDQSIYPTLIQDSLYAFLQQIPGTTGNPAGDIIFPPSTGDMPAYPVPQDGGTIRVTAKGCSGCGRQKCVCENGCPPGYILSVRRDANGNLAQVCRRKGRMNMLNAKALGRSVRRLAGFQLFATKTEKVIRASFMKAGVRPTSHRRIGGCSSCGKRKCSC